MDSRLHRIFSGAGGAGGGMGGPHPDSPLVDSSEQVYISSLALLKMLKHGIIFFPVIFLLSLLSFLFLIEA
jgi:26S proteasome regulatory subunit N11